MHTLIHLKGNRSSFTDGTLHDVHALDLLELKPGAIDVMDRRYVDFVRLHAKAPETGKTFVFLSNQQ